MLAIKYNARDIIKYIKFKICIFIYAYISHIWYIYVVYDSRSGMGTSVQWCESCTCWQISPLKEENIG